MGRTSVSFGCAMSILEKRFTSDHSAGSAFPLPSDGRAPTISSVAGELNYNAPSILVYFERSHRSENTLASDASRSRLGIGLRENFRAIEDAPTCTPTTTRDVA